MHKKILVGVGAAMLVVCACAWDFSEKAEPSQTLGFGAQVEKSAVNSIAISSCEGRAVVTATDACQIGTGSNGVSGSIRYRNAGYLLATPINGVIPAGLIQGGSLDASLLTGSVPTAAMVTNITAAIAGKSVVLGAVTAQGDVDGASNVSAWNQYCVIGPDQSVMLRMKPLSGLTNAQVVVFSPVFHVTPVVFLTYSATGGLTTNNSPYAASVTTNGFTVAGATTGITLNGLAIGGH